MKLLRRLRALLLSAALIQWRLLSRGWAVIPAVTAPILGARNVGQLQGSLASLDIDMTPELRAEIGTLSAEPPPANDRSEQRHK